VLIPVIAQKLLAEACRIAADGYRRLRCATVMPDHVHLFFTLGVVLSLSKVVARLKVKTRTQLAQLGVDWQKNFYDHRLRESDNVEDVIRYIHLNPYRKGLVREAEVWPFFSCDPGDWEWYRQTNDNGSPVPEWLR
jgi:REP element-mobilizing transposase RayT